MELRRRFGLLVKSYRQRRGMTQADLAAATGMSDTMISRIELGASGARFPTIQKIADALAIDPSQLFATSLTEAGDVSPTLIDLTARLSVLSEADLAWVNDLLGSALRTR